AVILTMDQTAPAVHAVRGLRSMSPDIPVLARARDEKHALALREAGADVVIPETLESSLQLAAGALARLGVPDEAARMMLDRVRDNRTHPLRNTS
nr:NAD-binding protein [Denitromonas sp.]